MKEKEEALYLFCQELIDFIYGEGYEESAEFFRNELKNIERI